MSGDMMTQAEYKEQLKQISLEEDKRKKLLAKRYALVGNTIVIGDVVRDSSGNIGEVCVVSSSIDLGGFPVRALRCKKLTTKMEPRKDGATIVIFGDVEVIQ